MTNAVDIVFPPSPLQVKIYDVYDNTLQHIVINAVAGSGKSSTIVELAKRTPANKRVVFLAFNRDIVAELRIKLKNYPHIEVKTLHAFGMNELMFKYVRGNNNVDKDKVLDDSKVAKVILKMAEGWTSSFLDEDGKFDETIKTSYMTRVGKIVDIARFALPQSRAEMIDLCADFDVQMFNGEIDKAKDVLRACNEINDRFDYTDMIYRPAIGNWRLKQYDVVIVDECQDLNKAQQTIIKKIVKPDGGRMVAVGDPYQAIYGFAGADVNSYNNLKSLFPNTVEMPLSVCYRCPSEIINHAKELVPQIEARPGASEGEVRQGSVTEIKAGDFVLCRNTRPLVSLCLKFIARGQKATVKGGDIGKNLIKMISDTKAKSLEVMWTKLNKNLDKIIAKAKEQNPLRELDEIPIVANTKDKLEAIRSIQEGFESRQPDDIIRAIESIFSEDVQSGIIFSTIHKSKGLEAKNIFLLERQLMPAKYATKPKDIVQETNLDYVARTRAKERFIYVSDWCSDPLKKKELAAAVSHINPNPNPPSASELKDFRMEEAIGKSKKRVRK